MRLKFRIKAVSQAMTARSAIGRCCIEAVEPRQLFNADYFNLAGGSFAQNWSDTALINVDDNWTAVPSISGFLGERPNDTTGVDPQTILTDPAVFTLNVNANQVTPTITTGGVAEFELSDPVVALKGSGTADAPFITMYLDATGRKDLQLSYNLRDIDPGANNAVQQVALQYRVGEIGTWTNLPAGYVADASIANATQSIPISLTLPALVNDQPKVQVRVMTTNAAGTDDFIGVDDILVTSAEAPVAPTGIMLNEVNVDPPTGADAPFEFIELKGLSGQTISDVYVLAVTGDGSFPGFVNASIALNNVSFGSNGLILIKAASGGFTSEDAATTVITTSKLNSAVLDNVSFSVLLVFSPTAITDFSTLDADFNGTLEGLPGGSEIIDSIAWKSNVDPGAGDQIYGADLTATPFNTNPLLQPPLTLDAASRVAGNTELNSNTAWFYGDLNNTGLGAQTKAYNTVTGYNMPSADARTTPGAANFSVGAPTVQSTSYAADQRPPALRVDFDKNVGASLVLSDGDDSSFILTNRDAGVRIEASKLSQTFGAGDVATIRSPGTSGNGIAGVLPDANYRLTVVASNVNDINNATLTADVIYDFFVLGGDANRDRKVNTLDFNILAFNFGAGGRVFSQGDFNYDTLVTSDDFNLFVSQYGKTVPEIPAPAIDLFVAGTLLFGTQSLMEGETVLDDVI